MNKSLILTIGLLALGHQHASAANETNAEVSHLAEQAAFTYQNPISKGIDPKGLRDCHVFRDRGRWYMTGTAWPHWPRQEVNGNLNPGIVLYSSDTLTEWKFEKFILAHGGPDNWYHLRFWAPEIHVIGGKYYALFNASNPELGYPGQHTGYAVADSLMGPYRVVTEAKPLCKGNDLTFFKDDDGKVWAFWNGDREFGIGFAPIDLEKGEFLTEPTTAILPAKVDMAFDGKGEPVMNKGYDGRPVQKIAKSYDWDSIGIEGACVIKRDGIYHLFYSSWTRGYEIGTATARSITGPWIKSANNPIYGSQSKTACEKVGIRFTGDPDAPFKGVGHNQVFTGPDCRLWLSCHGVLKSAKDRPMLVIDPIQFDSKGMLIRATPSHLPQKINGL
jgi:xylan 1,4-beta-xylosidase